MPIQHGDRKGRHYSLQATFEKPWWIEAKTLPFALFNGTVEFDGCLLLFAGEQAMRSEDTRVRREQVEEKTPGIYE